MTNRQIDRQINVLIEQMAWNVEHPRTRAYQYEVDSDIWFQQIGIEIGGIK